MTESLFSTPLGKIVDRIEGIPNAPGVYRIRCVENNGCYIGSTRWSLHLRLRRHFRDLRRGLHYNTPMLEDFTRVGHEGFVVDVLALCGRLDVVKLEQAQIDAHRADTTVKMYNLAPRAGCPLGRKLSLEARAKIAESNRRRTVSEETKERIRQSLLGSPQSEESRLNKKKAIRLVMERPGYREMCAEKGERSRKRVTEWHKSRRTPVAFELQFQNGELFSGNDLFEFAKERGLAFADVHSVVKGENRHCHGYHLKTKPMREFRLISPNGETIKCFNLRALCKKHNLDPSTLMRVLNGKAAHHKQWRKAE